jgi:ankyrin repeat protein
VPAEAVGAAPAESVESTSESDSASSDDAAAELDVGEADAAAAPGGFAALEPDDRDALFVAACGAGLLDYAEQLLDAGANLLAESNGKSGVVRAAETGFYFVVSALCERPGVLDDVVFREHALRAAAFCNDVELARKLIDMGTNIDCVIDEDFGGDSPPIFLAAFNCFFEVVELFVDKGAVLPDSIVFETVGREAACPSLTVARSQLSSSSMARASGRSLTATWRSTATRWSSSAP